MYLYGERVRINLPQRREKGDGITEGMREYQGKEVMVERIIFCSSQRAYELLGVTSPKGKVYTFAEEWLEPIGKEQNDDTDRTDHAVH